jgi:hypothetical protein
MYVLLLITGISVGNATAQPLDKFDDLQACEAAAAEQLAIAKVLAQKPSVHFRCQREEYPAPGPGLTRP